MIGATQANASGYPLSFSEFMWGASTKKTQEILFKLDIDLAKTSIIFFLSAFGAMFFMDNVKSYEARAKKLAYKKSILLEVFERQGNKRIEDEAELADIAQKIELYTSRQGKNLVFGMLSAFSMIVATPYFFKSLIIRMVKRDFVERGLPIS
jgi:hypothetical protein